MNNSRIQFKVFVILIISGFVSLIAIITCSSGCSGNNNHKAEIIFYGEGENWIAKYKSDSSQAVKEKVTLHFFYKGSLPELATSKQIVFSYGTTNGSITADTLNFDKVDRAYFQVEFDRDLIQGIVGNINEKTLVIVKWNNKSESLNLTQNENSFWTLVTLLQLHFDENKVESQDKKNKPVLYGWGIVRGQEHISK
ncbi:hypothetical protein [Paenibacillus abyssi]|uniref:Uncharacterized protein n=1 Tax=Paenibacillus abyssi TaxID=1340531 RepID=A0A917CLT0_9BACL|nr:hypothetical protein [Paenibacillus abyssi]GGF90484.1 hypothetical protein GCM10010916_04810 [Paenibacillus abyssi]